MQRDDTGPSGEERKPGGWRLWLSPPDYDDPIDRERSAALYRMLLWLLAVFALLGPFVPFLSPDPQAAALTIGASIAILIAGIVALRQKLRFAGAFITSIAWVVATVVLLDQGIARGSSGYAVVVVAAVLFWSARRAFIVALLSSVALFVGAELEWRGLLDVQGAGPSSVAVALDATIQLMILLTLSAAGLYGLRQAEARWRREARRHQDIVARSPDGIFFIDKKGRIESLNPAAEQLTGLRAEQVIGEFLWELSLVPERDELRARKVFAATLAGERRDGMFDVEIRGAGGEQIPIEVHARRVRRPEGGHGVMATCRDLRERRRGEAERAQLEEMLNAARRMESVGRLAGGVAHDFNNLLTVMLTNTELLLGERTPGPHWRDDVEQIRSAAKRASDLTQQLLAFARRETLEPQLLNLNEPLTGLRDLLERLCGESIAVEYELGQDIPSVLLDRARLEQVVMNLAANSRDAMPRGGTLTIRTSTFRVDEGSDRTLRGMDPGVYAWLRVLDTGEGMDEDTAAHIFEPFFTTKRDSGGTGLGLATVHGIIGQSGGFVFVESKPGIGTAFDIFFPESSGEAVTIDSPPPAWSAGEALRDATILFVEDEAVVGRITQRVLEERGYEVLWAQGVEEAREAWRERAADVDLLLSDVVMPDGFGPDLARELRVDRPELRVLYVSGYDDGTLGQPMAAEDSGFVLVRKPFSIDRLVDNVERALSGDPTPPSPRAPAPVQDQTP